MYDSSLGKALIVDDEATNRLILKSMLSKQGYETIEAADGQEAIDLFKLEQPNIVFMDVMMPGVDGGESSQGINLITSPISVPGPNVAGSGFQQLLTGPR